MLLVSWRVFFFAGFQQLLDDLDDLCLDTPDAPEVIYCICLFKLPCYCNLVCRYFLSYTYGSNKQNICACYIIARHQILISFNCYCPYILRPFPLILIAFKLRCQLFAHVNTFFEWRNKKKTCEMQKRINN